MNSNNSITMDLENLQQKYSDLLIKYKAAVSEYILFLNNESKKSRQDQPELVSIQGQAYIGTDSAGQSSAKTLQDCIASCSSNSKCTGATFISNKCDIRTGDSEITPSTNDSYAIIPKSKQLLLNMENINQQLLIINKEINDKIQIYQPQYYENNKMGKQKTQELLAHYENLSKERETILKMLNQYEILDRTEEQNQIKINQNYYTYILLTILAIAIIYLLYKASFINMPSTVQYGGDLGIGTYYIIFIIILIIISLNFYFRYFYKFSYIHLLYHYLSNI